MALLQSKKLLSHYIRRLKNNEIVFLSGNDSDRTQLYQLTIDLRDILRRTKDPDRAKKQIEKASTIWMLLMRNALKHISRTYAIRGFGELFRYYEKYVEFEDFLFGVDPTYRDHTMHALWVYLLGDFLLNCGSCISTADIDWEVHAANSALAAAAKEKLVTALSEYEDSVFCIIALSHDLGYPFERAERANRRIEDISPFLGISSFDRLRFAFSTEQSLLIRALVEFISTQVYITDVGMPQCHIDEPVYVDMSQSFEGRRHGILSAYLLHRLIDTMGEIPVTSVQRQTDPHSVTKHVVLRRTILHAISSHTCPYAFSRKYNTFRFVLNLVDELEEFSRYMRVGRSDADEICQVDFDIERDGVFVVKYSFDRKHSANPKKFFEDRAIRYMRMIEADNSAQGIRRVLMQCIDKKGRRKRYTLKIDASGIFCRLPGKRGRYEALGQDPENSLIIKMKKMGDS